MSGGGRAERAYIVTLPKSRSHSFPLLVLFKSHLVWKKRPSRSLCGVTRREHGAAAEQSYILRERERESREKVVEVLGTHALSFEF